MKLDKNMLVRKRAEKNNRRKIKENYEITKRNRIKGSDCSL